MPASLAFVLCIRTKRDGFVDVDENDDGGGDAFAPNQMV